MIVLAVLGVIFLVWLLLEVWDMSVPNRLRILHRYKETP